MTLDFSDVRVLVVGDAMEDVFIHGRITRKSPEADCDVFVADREVYTPGGAANVVRNVNALGAVGELVSGRGLITKVRYVADGRHLLRMDYDGKLDTTNCIEDFEFCTNIPDVIIVSDYAKGTVTDELLGVVFAAAAERKIPVVVDPKGTDFARYNGATVLMPNESEWDSVIDPGHSPALVTMGAAGMRLCREHEPDRHFSGHRVMVKDVAGAGDTATAIVALMLAKGHSLDEAAPVANVGAALVVAKPDVATVSIDELNAACHKPVVGLVNGCFDMLHPGHFHMLWQARQHCERLVVGLNSDSSVRELKGEGRPLQCYDARQNALMALHFVDAVVSFNGDADRLIEQLAPDIVIRGWDQKLPAVLCKCVRVPRLGDYATTDLKNKGCGFGDPQAGSHGDVGIVAADVVPCDGERADHGGVLLGKDEPGTGLVGIKRVLAGLIYGRRIALGINEQMATVRD